MKLIYIKMGGMVKIGLLMIIIHTKGPLLKNHGLQDGIQVPTPTGTQLRCLEKLPMES